MPRRRDAIHRIGCRLVCNYRRVRRDFRWGWVLGIGRRIFRHGDGLGRLGCWHQRWGRLRSRLRGGRVCRSFLMSIGFKESIICLFFHVQATGSDMFEQTKMNAITNHNIHTSQWHNTPTNPMHNKSTNQSINNYYYKTLNSYPSLSQKSTGNLLLASHYHTILGQYTHARSCVINGFNGILYLMQTSLGGEGCGGWIVTACHVCFVVECRVCGRRAARLLVKKICQDVLRKWVSVY